MHIRSALFCAFGIPALLLVIAGAFGQQRVPAPTQPDKQPSGPVKNSKTIEQNFPSEGPMETAWKVEWDTAIGYGLIIKSAWFKKGPDAEWMQVIGDARVADILVPYQPGTPRFWDIAYNFNLSVMSSADVGPTGKLLLSNNGDTVDPCVALEVRDRGVIWKNNFGVRRGSAMVLWGCLHAINYRYLMEYHFQDDGSIAFRMGSTGRNLQGKEWTPHMHNYYWRVNMNIGGQGRNTAYLMENVEPKSSSNVLGSETFHKLFNDGKEGWADWDPYKFTMLRILDPQKKSLHGDPVGYDLVPMRHGTSRHAGQEEECSQHDFWVTKNKPNELRYRGVPKYCDGEDIVNTDIVVWYGTSMFPEPRSEDGIMENDSWYGATIVSWIGFTLRPNNVFDRTPLFPNPKEPVQPKRKGGKKG